MKKLLTQWRFPVLFFSLIVFSISSCKKFPDIVLRHFDQVNLVDNNGEYHALRSDPTLINAWGIAFNPGGIAWVNSQGGGVAEIFDQEGAKFREPVWIPGSAPKVQGNPSGIVFNSTGDFQLSNGKPALFIMVGFDGILSGWNPGVGGTAELIKNRSATSAFAGLAISKYQGNNYIYAADFKAHQIITWDKNFNKVSFPFVDPTLPQGYSPFNIQTIGNWLYVTYAKFAPETGKNEAGEGKGYVSIFSANGTFVKRFASAGGLNSPWGIAHASASFFRDNEDVTFTNIKGGIKDMILVGNFGDGKINAYLEDGTWVGVLKSRGQPIVIEGLWALTFAPANSPVDPNRLYFSAGPDSEKDGLFGYIIKR